MNDDHESVAADEHLSDEQFTATLLDAIREAHEQYLATHEPTEVFHFLLNTLVRVTESEYGFLDEVLHDEDGTRYKLSLALSDISWDDESKRMYTELKARNLEFRNLENLAGAPAVSGELVIANELVSDPRSGGLPVGHPPIRSFMGMPLYFGGALVGVGGIANRRGGFDEGLAGRLSPFLSTCASLIHATRQSELQAKYVRDLERSKRQMGAILDASPESSFLIEPDGTILDGNEPFARRLGFEVSELIGKNVYDYIPKENAENRKKWVRMAIRDRAPQRFEDTKIDRVFRHNIVPIVEESGRVERLAIFGSDITEVRVAERDMRSLAAIVEAAPNSITIHDQGGRFLYANEKTFEMHGYSAEEFMELNLHELDLPESAALIEERVRRTMEEGEATFEVGHRRKGGSILPLEVSVRPFKWQGEPGMLSIGRDICERKAAEEALRRSEAKFRAVFATSPDSIVLLRLADAVISDVNEGFVQTTGFSRDDVIGRTTLEVGIWSEADDRERLLEQLRSEGVVRNFEGSFRCKDGSLRFGLCSSCIVEVDGEQCILSITRDITERKTLEGRLLQAQKMESVGRLAGGIAHDFNNILTVINGQADLLLDELDEVDPITQSIDEIRTAGERAATLTRQLLAFSQKQMVAPRVLDPSSLIRELSRTLKGLLGEDVELELRLSDDVGRVRMDRDQLEQVFVNLAVNARDAMSGRGRLSIASREVELDEGQCQRCEEIEPGCYVEITVRDSGCGMSEEVRQHLFEPFFTTKPFGQGAGLGLSTIYGTLRQAGGFIDIASEVGEGTTFTLYLPCVDAVMSADNADDADTSSDMNGQETVVVVEDEPTVRKMARKVLERFGYRVLEAADGEAGVRLAEHHRERLDLLLTDVVMPGIDGKQMAERFVALHPETKVLYTSGYPEAVIADHGILKEGLAFVSKPYTPEELIGKLRRLLAS